MRLTGSLCRYIRNNPNGNIWTGKNRLAHHIFPHQKENFIRKLQIEEKNLALLRNPYISREAEELYDEEVLKPDEKADRAEYRQKVLFRCRPSVRAEDRLGHLNVNNSWEYGGGY